MENSGVGDRRRTMMEAFLYSTSTKSEAVEEQPCPGWSGETAYELDAGDHTRKSKGEIRQRCPLLPSRFSISITEGLISGPG